MHFLNKRSFIKFSFYQKTSQYYHTTLQIKYPEGNFIKLHQSIFTPPPSSPDPQMTIVNLSRHALIIHHLVTHYYKYQ